MINIFASTCSESCETLFLPIGLEANLELRTAKVDIPGVMTSTGKPMINEFNVVAHDDCDDATERSAYGAIARCGYAKGTCAC